MWQEVKKLNIGRNVRTTPAVNRTVARGDIAMAVFPSGDMPTGKATVLVNGHRVAFLSDENGAFTVGHIGSCTKVKIPRDLTHLVPIGTTDVVMTRDGDMWVLDLDQLSVAGRVAAE